VPPSAVGHLRVTADSEALLVEWAAEVRDALSLQLNTRRSLLKAAAAQLRASGDRNPVAMRQTLLAVQSGFVTRVLTPRWSDMARDAEAVKRGQQHALANPAGADEVGRIGATLSQPVNPLQQDKQALPAMARRAC
jgi:ActR/RegA family two-component response regulator